jgi:hypothetical protein
MLQARSYSFTAVLPHAKDHKRIKNKLTFVHKL